MENQGKHMNSPEVVERLVEENYNLIHYMVQQFLKNGSLQCGDKEEAEWYATDTLLKAAQKFDESRGYNFSTFACVCIRNEIKAFIGRKQRYLKYHQELPVIKDKADREVNPFDLLNPKDAADEARLPWHRRDPLSVLLEKDRKQQVKKLAEEASWWGNEYINTFIDYYYRDDLLSQGQLGGIVGISQANVSKRVVTVVEGGIPTLDQKRRERLEYDHIRRKNKEIKQFKQELQALR